MATDAIHNSGVTMHSTNSGHMRTHSIDSPRPRAILPQPELKKHTKTSKTSQSSRIGEYVYFTPAIGKGSYSKVFLGHKITDPKNSPNYVAIKRISTNHMKKLSAPRIKREIELLKKLSHPNIVSFHDAFADIGRNVYIVTEWCNYGDLNRFTKTEALSHEEICDCMRQLRDALRYLLKHNILHRDIKPQNILLNKDQSSGAITVKIADFGFAKAFDNLSEDSMTETLCGTPMYLSPEVIKTKKYAIPSDLWSVGVILFELFYHTTPFTKPRNILELIRNIEQMHLLLPLEPVVNAAAKDLMTILLQTDPIKRCSWGNFFDHPWMGPSAEFKEAEHFPDVPPLIDPKQLDQALSDDEQGSDSESDTQSNLADSGIGRIKQLLHPTPSLEDELRDKEYVSKLISPPNIMENYLNVLASSSLPTERKISYHSRERKSDTLQTFISSIGYGLNSLSPLITSAVGSKDAEGFMLDSKSHSLTRPITIPRSISSTSTGSFGSRETSSHNSPWSQSWLSTKKWAEMAGTSGEGIARAIGDSIRALARPITPASYQGV